MNDPNEKKGSAVAATIAAVIFGVCLGIVVLLAAMLIFGDFWPT